MRIGSLFSGAGGLDMAVEQVFGGDVVWHCENDPAASKVLAHRWPGIPNHSDITKVDWSQVEPVDVLCGGWPCQPFSLAGKRNGADDERALWPYVAGAVRMVRPRIVVLENVSAVLGPEFQRVANNLAALRYDIAWTCVRASDVGAPHRRERLFVVAHAAGQFGSAVAAGDDATALDAAGPRAGDRGSRCVCGHEAEDHSGLSGWSTACLNCLCNGFIASDTASDGRHEGRPEPARLVGGSDAAVSGDGPLLPIPVVNDAQGPTTPEQIATMRANGAGVRNLNETAVYELLPTPRTSDTNGAGAHGDGGLDLRTTVSLLPSPRSHRRGDCESERNRKDPDLEATTHYFPKGQWGKYEPAIRRWEALTRQAPAPTELNKNGNPRLSAAFSEWMLGWPEGHITQVPGISRNDQLRIIGNGVVPQQASAALRYLLTVGSRLECRTDSTAAADGIGEKPA